MNSKPILLKLGGSIIVPSKDNVDVDYLKKLRDLIKTFPDKKFIITIGGGYTCRWYQEALNDAGFTEHMIQHEMGVAVCNMNAELVRLIFGDIADEEIYMGKGPLEIKAQVLITGVWVPGASSNADAVEIAYKSNSDTIVNLSNIDYLYDKDPREFPDAKKLEKINWTDYRKMFNVTEHKPGAHIPIDVIAADLADAHEVKFYFMNGHDLENLKNVIDGEGFKGTIIG